MQFDLAVYSAGVIWHCFCSTSIDGNIIAAASEFIIIATQKMN